MGKHLLVCPRGLRDTPRGHASLCPPYDLIKQHHLPHRLTPRQAIKPRIDLFELERVRQQFFHRQPPGPVQPA